MRKLKLTLLDNCHSFLNEALRNVVESEKDHHRWHFALLFLVQSVELAFKEKLRQEHPVLIFKDVDDPRFTVSLDQALRRLRSISKVQVTDSDAAAIRTAREWRNLVVHSEFEFTEDSLKPVFAQLLGFLADFHTRHFKFALSDYVQPEYWKAALAISEYVSELQHRAQTRIAEERIEGEFVWKCPSCLSGTFIIQDGIDACYVCNYQEPVVQCEHCDEMYFESDTEQLTELYGGDREINITLCNDCAAKERQRDSDNFDWDPN